MSAFEDKFVEELAEYIKGPGRLARALIALVCAFAISSSHDEVFQAFAPGRTLEDTWNEMVSLVAGLPTTTTAGLFLLILLVIPFVNRLTMSALQSKVLLQFVKGRLSVLSEVNQMSHSEIVKAYGRDMNVLLQMRANGKRRVARLVTVSEGLLFIALVPVIVLFQLGVGLASLQILVYLIPAWLMTSYIVSSKALVIILSEVVPYRVISERLMALNRESAEEPVRETRSTT